MHHSISFISFSRLFSSFTPSPVRHDASLYCSFMKCVCVGMCAPCNAGALDSRLSSTKLHSNNFFPSIRMSDFWYALPTERKGLSKRTKNSVIEREGERELTHLDSSESPFYAISNLIRVVIIFIHSSIGRRRRSSPSSFFFTLFLYFSAFCGIASFRATTHKTYVFGMYSYMHGICAAIKS